jgi:hypothetical protein
MIMVSVSSSMISRVGYDSETAQLTIDFASGDRYTYFGVPPAAWSQLMKSKSPGAFFSDNIRERYSFSRK